MLNAINWQDLNIMISVTTSIMSAVLAIYAWRRRHVQGAMWFAGLVLAVSWVTGCYAFEAAGGPDVNTYVSFSKIEYIGLTFIPLLWLGFALNFSGKERPLSPAVLALLTVIPIITILAAFTNDWHGLIWKEPRFDMRTDPATFAPVYGAVFWVYVVYSYLIFLVGSIALVRGALRLWKLYRAQALLFLVGTSVAWIGNLIIIFDALNPFPFLYVNAVSLGLCALAFFFGLFRLRLLDITPLAYDTILNNVPDGVIVADMKNRIVALNPNVRPFLDHPDEDPIGKPLNVAFSRYAADVQVAPDAFDFKSTMTIDNLVVEVKISPVVDRQGRRRGRLFIFSDVTARARMERAQQEEQLFAETMLEIGSTLNSALDTNRVLALIIESIGQFIAHSHANIMIVEDDGVTTRVRQHRGYSPQAAARLEAMVFDYRNYPTLAKSALSAEPIFVPDTRTEVDWRVVEGLEDIRSFACSAIRVDGDLVGFINIDNTTPGTLKPEMGSHLQVFAHQAAVAIKNARLVSALQSRAAELEQLYERVSRLEQLKSDMIRVAAHDLKNPLSIVLNYLLLLSEDAELSLTRDEVFGTMLRSARRMNQIIEDFLSLERIEKVAQQQTMQPVDLREVVAKVVDEFATRASQKSQHLTSDLPSSPCMVNADPVLLYEAAANFLTNAIKYTPEGGRITVSVVREGDHARLEVRDTGYGIPKDRQARLFEPFYRARTSETKEIEGTGLGLYLTKNIVERQGGAIIFRSVHGKGSTFGFQLPIYQPEKALDDQEAQAAQRS